MDIYKIENLINGKKYVGQSTSLKTRFIKHRKNAEKKVNRYLYDAMNKYGHENFSISLIEETSKENADAREIFWIAELGTLHPHGYNMTPGGGGGNTLATWSEEDRKALYKQQGDKRRGPRREDWKASIAKASVIREAAKAEEQRREIARKISTTNKTKGIKFPKHVMYGKDNPNHVEVDAQECVALIASGWKLKELAAKFKTTTVTVGAKLKEDTGKTFTEWRREHGIVGSFGKPRRSDPA